MGTNNTNSGGSGGANPNIAASWPIIVMNEELLNETSILPHLLHEASEEAQQQQQNDGQHQQQNGDYYENDEITNNNNDEQQLQNMIENYSKHVIRQKQQPQQPQPHQQQTSSKSGTATGRSASHLQRKINAAQTPTPMSHSHPCLLSDSGSSKEQQQQASKRVNATQSLAASTHQQADYQQPPPYVHQQHSDPRELSAGAYYPLVDSNNGNAGQYQHQQQYWQLQQNGGGGGQQQRQQPQQFLAGDQQQQQLQQQQLQLFSAEIMQLKQQNEKLAKKCDRLEQLESAYRKIERDYEAMLSQHECRDELGRVMVQKLEQQCRALATDCEQLRAQNAKMGAAVFGQQMREGGGGSDGDQQHQQIHFLLNELIPKNKELLLIQERQRLELEAQNNTLEEQRTHIDVLEKALANAQERLAAKERSAVDAVAVVDKCRHLQRMLQEALEDKQRQKEQHRAQVAQLEMELTQLRLQLSKEAGSQAALGSLGRKGGGTMASGGASPEGADESLKLRKALGQKEERISQLEASLLQMQRRFGGYEDAQQQKMTGETELTSGSGTPKFGAAVGGGGRVSQAELEARAMRLELEKAEKERRIQELLDEKMRIQMQWAEERRSLDVRVRLLEKDIRAFVGSQSSLASSGGYGGAAAFGGGGPGAHFLHDYSDQHQAAINNTNSPFSSIRGYKSSSYLRHRSTAELPTSARGAALYDDQRAIGGGGMDVVMARMDELGRKLAERRAKVPAGGEQQQRTTTSVQRPSELGLVQLQLMGNEQQQRGDGNGGGSQSRSSSTEQQPPLPSFFQAADFSPGSEDHASNGAPLLQRQSAPSSAGSSSKKGPFHVNTSPSQLSAYLEQLPEATKRRLTERAISAGGFHPLSGEQRNAGSGPGRREGGCRRLIRDGHSVDARSKGMGGGVAATENVQQLVQPPMLAPPPNYNEAAAAAVAAQQQRREAPPPPPPPPYQQPQQQILLHHQQQQQKQQLKQLHQMSSIEEPMMHEPPLPPPAYQPLPPQANASLIEVGGSNDDGDEEGGGGGNGDSDTLTGHKQLVFRRSSLGNNANVNKI